MQLVNVITVVPSIKQLRTFSLEVPECAWQVDSWGSAICYSNLL